MDDSIYDDPAVSRAGTAAFGLYCRCGAYVARHLLDGLVPPDIAAQYGTTEWRERLLSAGLWETAPGGQFYMPRYFQPDKNPTRARVLADRAAAAARQQKWLANSRSGRSNQRRVSRRVTNTSGDTSITPSITPALPPSFQEGSARGAAPNAPPPASRRADHRTVAEAKEHAQVSPNGHVLEGEPPTGWRKARQAMTRGET